MDSNRINGVHIESEVVRPLPVFDTGIRPKLKCTLSEIHRRN